MSVSVQHLLNAKKQKKDEFYTLYGDIDKEMSFCKDVFRGKTVYCNCDDPFMSNFVWWFIDHFNEIGLKGLNATCYSEDRPALGVSISTIDRDVPDGYRTNENGRTGFLRDLCFRNGNSIRFLKGNGSFDSKECLQILDESDIVITNPPFSLVRRFLKTVTEHGCEYIILGNLNTIASVELMTLLLGGKLFIGASIHKGSVYFRIPEEYPVIAKDVKMVDGVEVIGFSSIRWLTSMKYGIGSYSCEFDMRYMGNESLYRRFDNYEAINVPKTKMIPVDYPGIMGVPLTYLDRYDPNEFQLLGAAIASSFKNGFNRKIHLIGNKSNGAKIDGKDQYARLFIKNLHPKTNG